MCVCGGNNHNLPRRERERSGKRGRRRPHRHSRDMGMYTRGGGGGGGVGTGRGLPMMPRISSRVVPPPNMGPSGDFTLIYMILTRGE